MIEPLALSALYQSCDFGDRGFDTTADLENLSETIGQERALSAIDFAVGMPHDGFNLYVMGSAGLGRHTLVRAALKKETEGATRPPDLCYTANFQHPHSPNILSLPAGTGRRLRTDMQQLIDDLITAIPAAFEGDEYRRRAKEAADRYNKKQDEVARELGLKAEQRNIVLVRGPSGFTLTPQKNGKVLTTEEFDQLPEAEQESLSEVLEEMKEDLKESMRLLPKWQQEMRQEIKALDRETTSLTVGQFIGVLEGKYREFGDILRYLGEVKEDIIENVLPFRQNEPLDEKAVTSEDKAFIRYRINILVDNSETRGAPIIFETNPTYQNLMGRIEHIASFGTLRTDFTLIKAGALHRANGGYLILDAEKVLSNPFAWEGLKRVLNSKQIRIESLERQLSLVSTISLEPQPVAVDLKVVLVGSRLLYYLLKQYDPELGLLFKVAADFSEQFPREGENEYLYARLIATLQHRDGLREISRNGVARIIEHCSRTADDGEKLSLHMGSLMELLQEANYRAQERSSNLVQTEDVQKAIDARAYRAGQLKEQLREQIVRGTVSIDTSGIQLAQVNGLTVITLGGYRFGTPIRISATARMGNGQVVDIEREAEQGGPIHSKGVLILTSYLGAHYAKNQPLSVAASLVFEQTYGMVEGDSASAAELCALLSALGDIPIRQSLAITGSINQHGQVQAIGGVCQKIEGFFEICKARGLTGEQGVIVPKANVKDLMLHHDVVEAAEAGKFFIYAVDHVEQALELLTGLPAGRPNADGIYPEESVNYRIQLRLAEWSALQRQYAGREPLDE